MTKTGGSRAERLVSRLRELQRIGAGGAQRGADRPAFSRADQDGHDLVAGWMREAGLDVSYDDAGNLWGRLAGSNPALAPVWTGSHLDAVPAGGHLDGALGVVAGLEALATIAAGDATERSLAVVSFRDEEGWRFAHSFYGSLWVTGGLDPAVTARTDAEGVTVGAAREQLGLPASPPAFAGPRPAAFVELHIEQGPVLAERSTALGVVTSVVGMAERTVTFKGEAGHAGTVPMKHRRDAVRALARFAEGLLASAETIPGAVATVGSIDVRPGAANVVPSLVQASVDVRCGSDDGLARLLDLVEDAATEAARTTGCELDLVSLAPVPPAAMDDAIARTLLEGAHAAGVDAVRLPSGAGHDAGVIAAAGIPTGMLFVRSEHGGVSHSPDEDTRASDLDLALEALTHSLRALSAL